MVALPYEMASSEGSGAASGLTFHEFLERMKQPSAADLVRRIRSFMVGLMGKDPEPDKDGESVQEFYRATEALISTHPLWKGASAEELDASGEALERYLMIKIFPKAFAAEAEEKERDDNLSLRISALHHFLQPKHLDIPHHLQNDASWLLAEKELLKMGTFKTPKDKLQCLLNCCKIINNLLLNASITAAASATQHTHPSAGSSHVTPPGADDFLPVLIYVLVKTNPPQLISNLLYIQRYRSIQRLSGEASYFYTNVVSAASFLESVTASQLTIDKDEFDKLMSEGIQKARNESQPAGGSARIPGGDPGTKEITQGAPGTLSQAGTPEGLSNRKDSSAQAKQQEKETIVTVESIQERPEVVGSILRADSSGELARQFRFLYAKPGDLTLGDVPDLLHSYKDLAIRYFALCRAVHGVKLVLPPVLPSLSFASTVVDPLYTAGAPSAEHSHESPSEMGGSEMDNQVSMLEGAQGDELQSEPVGLRAQAALVGEALAAEGQEEPGATSGMVELGEEAAEAAKASAAKPGDQSSRAADSVGSAPEADPQARQEQLLQQPGAVDYPGGVHHPPS